MAVLDPWWAEKLLNVYDSQPDGELALFHGDPRLEAAYEFTDVECPGYERADLPAAGWEPAEGYLKAYGSLVQFADADDVWDCDDAPSYWVIYIDGHQCDSGPVTRPIRVTEAGAGPKVAVRVWYEDSLDTP